MVRMNSFPRFMNKVRYPYYGRVIRMALDFVEMVDGDVFVRTGYVLKYGRLDPEVIGAFCIELKKIGMRVEVDVDMNETGTGIETIMRVYPRRCYMGKDIGGRLRESLEGRVDMARARRDGNLGSDFFPPYFNVHYVFGNMRGKQLQKLRSKVYCFLEDNNFPKKFHKSQMRISMKDELYLKPEHYEQIRRELLLRGIVFDYYKNLFCDCVIYNSSSGVDCRLSILLRFG